MLPIAYTISPYLLRYLEQIEQTRQRIILFPIAPQKELQVLFQTITQRIHYALSLNEQILKPETIKTILANQIVISSQKHPERYGKIQNVIINYKQAFDYLRRSWLLSTDAVTPMTLRTLYAFFSEEQMPLPDKRLQELLDYLQSTNDNPFVISALAKLECKRALPETEEHELFSTLCAYLFLYKAGMDCRGLLILEKPWSNDKRIYHGQYQTTMHKQNITSWIEYYVKLIAVELSQTYQSLNIISPTHEQPSIARLNERQKTIMTLLDDPQTVITNRTLQKIFHISQITASRDLAKLTMLGLLFPHGKGRSVRYTRI